MEIPPSKLKSSLSSILPAMTSNSNQMDMSQHPLEAIATSIQNATSSEHRGNRVSHMMSTNEGPADIIGKVSGAVPGGKRVDDGPYFTNNEGIPFPDPYVLCLST
jgi:catalase